MRRRRPSRSPVTRAAAFTVEALEGRQYFVTLTGNSEFIFHDPEVDLDVPRQIQVNTTGNIVVELVGAAPNQFGGIDLVEIPGSLNGTPLLGGVGGRGGVRLLEASGANGIDVVDPNGILPGFGGLAFDVEGNDDINFRALASTESGVMYGINVFDFSTGAGTNVDRRALLVRFDNPTTSLEATVIADLTSSILTPPLGAANLFADDIAADPVAPATVNGVTAAAFDPAAGAGNSILYFAAAGGVGNRPQLFSVDVSAANPAAIAASVTGFTGSFGSVNALNDDNVLVPNFNNVVVNSIAFDQLTPTTSRLLAVVTRDVRRVVAGGQAFETDRVMDVRVSPTPTGLGNAGPGREVTYEGESVVNITGMEFAAENEAAQDDIVFFITAGSTTEEGLLDQGGAGGGGGTDGGAGGEGGVTLDPFLLQGDLSQGTAGAELPLLLIGSLPDANDTVEPIRGTDLQGLTWVDDGPGGVTDPITGAEAAFVAVDATSDELVVISAARRAPNADLFHIRIVSADEDATFSVVSTEVINNELQILPFTGAPQPFKARPISGPLISVSGDPGIGRVWIGGRTLLNPLSDLPVPGFLPFIQAPQTQAFGTLPPVPSLTAGISTAPGVDIGKILIGGAVTGRVDLGGSIDTFYAGWLLTGNVEGTPGSDPGVQTLSQESGGNTAADDTIDTTNNFLVAGDARVVISRGSIGTNTISAAATNYSTQFDAEVGGELGHFQTHNSLYGGVQVSNAAGAGFDVDNNSEEYETHFGGPGALFVQGLLGGEEFLFNDTLDNPQYLNAIGQDTVNGFVRVDAVYEVNPTNLVPEPGDTFAVALMAGQTYVAQSTIGALSVYDPDNRRIASDSAHFGANAGRPFRFTADRPGIYKFQIVTDPGLTTPYTLIVRGAGNLALGGISATNEVFNNRSSGAGTAAGPLVDPNDPLDYTSFVVRSGDFGAMFAGTTIAFAGEYLFRRSTFDFSGRDDFRVDNGNFRALDGGQVGLSVIANGFGPNIQVTQGDIGLLRARSALMNIETANIGGSMQVGDASGTGYIQLNAKGGLGVFRAGDLESAQPSIFRVNSDESGFDGIIGLIDSQGDLGVIGGTGVGANIIENFQVFPSDSDVNPFIPGGGPQITTGQGGNVRYIHVGGNVYPDIFFGGNEPEGTAAIADGGETVTGQVGQGGGTLYDPGLPLNFADDGGGTIRLVPVGLVSENPDFLALDTNGDGVLDDRDGNNVNLDAVPRYLGPQFNVRAYPVRSGGSVLISVDAVGSSVQGVRIEGRGDNRSVEIGQVNVSGSASGLTLNTDELPILPGGPTRSTSSNRRGPLLIGPDGLPVNRNTRSGNGPLVIGPDGLPVNRGNDSGGPLVVGSGGSTPVGGGGQSLTVPGIGTDASPVVVQYTGAARVDVFDTSGSNITSLSNDSGGEMPLIRASDIASLTSSTNIGVARPVAGTAINPQTLLAPPTVGGSAEFPFVQQRIGVVATNLGVVRAGEALGNLIVSGAINQIAANSNRTDNVGVYEGIVAPILATGNIGTVQIGEGLAPSGSGSVAQSGLFSGGIIYNVINQGSGSDIMGDVFAATQIRNITLRDGSIINSDIGVNTNFIAGSVDPGGGGTLPNLVSSFDSRQRPLGNITLTGQGGIIGSQITAADMATISVGGFGILASQFQALNLARIGRISAANYGIRYVNINAGGSLDTLTATGDGRSVSTATFAPSVRLSETQPVDEFFGVSFDPFFNVPTGILTDLHAVLGTSAAVPEIAGVTDTGVIENVDARGGRTLGSVSAYQIRTRQTAAQPQLGLQFPNQFNFGEIRSLKTRSLIDGLAITAGRLGTFAPGSDVFRFLATISSSVNSIRINGSLGESSQINVGGAGGQLGTVVIGGDLDGILRATSRIRSVTVGGVTTGQVIVDNRNAGTNIGTLTAQGGVGTENLVINGSVGNLVVGKNQAFGTVGSTLTVNGNLAGVTVRGGTLDTNIVVNGNIGAINVKGTLVGNISATGDVRTISVANAEGAATNSVLGNIDVAGNLNTFTINGGNLVSNVNVGGTLNKFNQNRGSVLAAAAGLTLPTFAVGQALRSFSTTGNVVANLAADVFGSVTIRGDYGDGATPLTSTATGDWGVLSVFGSIRTGASTTIAGTLGSLVVGGNVEAGATVAAAAIGRKNISGAVAGTVTP